MKWIKMALAVLGQLIAVGIVLALIAATDSRFEKIVVCGLILLYVKLSIGAAHVWHMSAATERANVSRFLELKRLLRADVSNEAESLRDSDDQFEQAERFHFIRLFGTCACGIIALVALLGAL